MFVYFGGCCCFDFFKNTVVCAEYVVFSGHAEIFSENSEVLFHYYCLAVIQLAVFFLHFSYLCYSNFLLFFLLNLSPVLFFPNLQISY